MVIYKTENDVSILQKRETFSFSMNALESGHLYVPSLTLGPKNTDFHNKQKRLFYGLLAPDDAKFVSSRQVK